MKLAEKIDRIVDKIRHRESLITALSGGVDSSVVAALAYRALGEKALAVTIASPFTVSEDLRDSARVAGHIGISHLIVHLNELELPGLKANPPERCYLCKKYRFTKLKELARERGYREVADGTNLDDLAEHRPGLKASRELGVYSPLVEGEMTREDVLAAAEFLGLPVAGKPHNSCLATRVPYGEELTIARLKRIDEAEQYLHGLLKTKDLRLREHGSLVRLELDRAGVSRLLDEATSRQAVAKLKELGYRYITLDVEGYRFGSFDE
jgi:uncharacterized protein